MIEYLFNLKGFGFSIYVTLLIGFAYVLVYPFAGMLDALTPNGISKAGVRYFKIIGLLCVGALHAATLIFSTMSDSASDIMTTYFQGRLVLGLIIAFGPFVLLFAFGALAKKLKFPLV